jgi:hypothetical protein
LDLTLYIPIGVIPSTAIFQAEREPALSERSESNGDLARIASAVRNQTAAPLKILH